VLGVAGGSLPAVVFPAYIAIGQATATLKCLNGTYFSDGSIVCRTEDVCRCLIQTEMDAPVLGNCFLRKDASPLVFNSHWQAEFQLN